MTPDERHDAARRAALNNARWCDTVCRAHGSPGDWADGWWMHRAKSPPVYPNLVTLRDRLDGAQANAAVHELCRLELPGPWAVKDSFAELDLEPLGLGLLFEAQWICCDASATDRAGDAGGLRWSTLSDAAALQAWEQAWLDAGQMQREVPRQFPDRLLADPDVRIVVARRDGALVAGGIFSATGGDVGLSNVFALDGSVEARLWRDLIGQARALFPGRPIVGYETEQSLADACAAGFEAVGPLRVWLREAACGGLSANRDGSP